MNKRLMPAYKSSVQKAEGDACESGSRANKVATFSGLCRTFEAILASRSESVAGEVLRCLPVPVQGVRVVRSEHGLKVIELGNADTREISVALASFIVHFAERLPRLSWAECFEVWARKRAQQCMKGESVLRNKRRWLWVLSSLQLRFQQWQPANKKWLQNQHLFLSCLLHEPQARIEEMWREHLFWFYYNYARRLLHLHNRPESTGYLANFVWPEKNDYRRLTHNSDASRVVVSIHMGDFFGAFRALSGLSDFGRQVISLRRDTIADHGMQHFSADRMNHRVVFHHQLQPSAIVSALRRGGCTLATLFDLREDFGRTVAVDFFGHRARFVKGPAQLAIMGRSPIFAFVCYERQGRNCIEMAPAIDTRLNPGESLQQATVRVTQALVKLAECWIRRWPAQWKYLTTLPAYFEAVS